MSEKKKVPLAGQRVKELKKEFNVTWSRLGKEMGYGNKGSTQLEKTQENAARRIADGTTKLDPDRAKMVVDFINQQIDDPYQHIRVEWVLGLSDDKTVSQHLYQRTNSYTSYATSISEEYRSELILMDYTAHDLGFVLTYESGDFAFEKVPEKDAAPDEVIPINEKSLAQMQDRITAYVKQTVENYIDHMRILQKSYQDAIAAGDTTQAEKIKGWMDGPLT